MRRAAVLRSLMVVTLVGLGGSAGSSEATSAQSWSLTRGLLMGHVCPVPHRF